MATADDKEVVKGHIHKWSEQKDGSSKCIAPYNNRMCIKILVTLDEYAHRMEAWNNYLELCKTTQAKKDYDEMCIAYKYGDKAKMREIMARVKKRCVVNPDFEDHIDEPKYLFKEEEYLSKPDFPDPMHAKNYYLTQ